MQRKTEGVGQREGALGRVGKWCQVHSTGASTSSRSRLSYVRYSWPFSTSAITFIELQARRIPFGNNPRTIRSFVLFSLKISVATSIRKPLSLSSLVTFIRRKFLPEAARSIDRSIFRNRCSFRTLETLRACNRRNPGTAFVRRIHAVRAVIAN